MSTLGNGFILSWNALKDRSNGTLMQIFWSIPVCTQWLDQHKMSSPLLSILHWPTKRKRSYLRMLFVDFNSEFNMITCRLVTNLTWLSQSTCHNRPTPLTLMLSICGPQGCILRPLLYTIYTWDCVPIHPNNTIIMFADDTIVVWLISWDDAVDYRSEIKRLVT